MSLLCIVSRPLWRFVPILIRFPTPACRSEPTAAAAAVDDIHKADIRLSDICNLLGDDWLPLAAELEVPADDRAAIAAEYGATGTAHQAMVMLRLWLRMKAHRATGNQLELALHAIGRSDVVERCIFNLALVTDDVERATAKAQLVAVDAAKEPEPALVVEPERTTGGGGGELANGGGDLNGEAEKQKGECGDAFSVGVERFRSGVRDVYHCIF